MTDSAAALLRLLAIVAAIAALIWFERDIVKTIRAPVQAELSAARGNNAALKSGAEAQNRGVDGLKTASDQRKATSAAAVAAAGKPQQQRAGEILAAQPVGASDYERAMNRIDRELGLK